MSSLNIFTSTVPVIAVFTKFDALEKKAYQDLLDEDCPREEAKTKALQHALANFQQHSEDLYKRPYPPKSHVYLKGKQLVPVYVQFIMLY